MENQCSESADTQPAGSCDQEAASGQEADQGDPRRWDSQWDQDEEDACFIRSSN